MPFWRLAGAWRVDVLVTKEAKGGEKHQTRMREIAPAGFDKLRQRSAAVA